MEVVISSSGMRISARLETITRTKVGKLSRYLAGIDTAQVRYSQERNPRISNSCHCEVTLEGHGYHVRSRVSGPTPYAVLNTVVDKLERQLRRTKTRRMDRQQHVRQRKAG